MEEKYAERLQQALQKIQTSGEADYFRILTHPGRAAVYLILLDAADKEIRSLTIKEIAFKASESNSNVHNWTAQLSRLGIGRTETIHKKTRFIIFKRGTFKDSYTELAFKTNEEEKGGINES